MAGESLVAGLSANGLYPMSLLKFDIAIEPPVNKQRRCAGPWYSNERRLPVKRSGFAGDFALGEPAPPVPFD